MCVREGKRLHGGPVCACVCVVENAWIKCIGWVYFNYLAEFALSSVREDPIHSQHTRCTMHVFHNSFSY